MARQSFHDFINSGDPSTPRGRGRGGFRGGSAGRGGGRGGSSGGGTFGSGGRTLGGVPKNSYKADYSNVPFDYEKINNQKYTKMEGFSVQPFGGPSAPPPIDQPTGFTPRGRGGFGGRGRGRGSTPNASRGGHQFNQTPSRAAAAQAETPGSGTPSGAATPVHGLGFRKSESPLVPATRKHGDHRGLGLGRSTVGKGVSRDSGVVTWGGGFAPLFIKAGELFKTGEADVITLDDENKLHVEAMPMSDPSAPQMIDLRDQMEIDIMNQDPPSPLSAESSLPSDDDRDQSGALLRMDEQEAADALASSQQLDKLEDSDREELAQDDALEQLLASDIQAPLADDQTPAVTEQEPIFVEESTVTSSTLDITSAVEGLGIAAPDVENEGPEVETIPDVVIDIQGDIASPAVDETPLFFVDTDPSPALGTETPAYETTSNVPLGVSQSDSGSEEEQILFVPKTYKKPKPIALSIAAPVPAAETAPAFGRTFVNPKAMSRAEKKAAKREKRRGHKSGKGKKGKAKGKAGEREARMDSDIEWGSDGPPSIIMDVEGAGGISEDDDMEILRDYMEGTKLNAKTEREERLLLGEEVDEEESEDEEEEEIDLEAMRLFGQGIKGLTEGGQEIVDDDDEGDEIEDEWDSDDSAQSEGDNDEEEDEEDEEEDDDEGEDDSSVLGELDLEGMLDESDEDLDKLFNGTNQWNNETDWFINAMEDALDGKDLDMRDRTSRNKIFKAITDGDFGDDWGLEPYKKSKRDKHIPPELHAQWEKDRKAKAEKKQQRELERLIAEIDPDRSGYSRKAAAKAKGKGKGKAHQAEVAHLIPASAARIAEMFDISSDDDELDMMGLPPFKKGGRVPKGMSLQFVDDQINTFLDDRGKNSLALPPMDKEGRMKVHMLAEAYSLKSKSRGGGKTRFPVLIKTKRSGLVVDTRKIARLLSASTKVGGSFYKGLYSGGGGSGNPNKFKSRASGGPAASVRHREGDEVGRGAERIGSTNIGHQLLSKMGWAEGDRIGRGGGLEAPIVAIVKNTKSGLGA
ncbi:hypothetical protein IAU60_002938 [Kwoniella sp. DSM 27419]